MEQVVVLAAMALNWTVDKELMESDEQETSNGGSVG